MQAVKKNIPKLRFPEFSEVWEKPKLSSKMEVFRGASPRPKSDKRYYGGNIPRLMIEDVTRDGKYAFPKIDYLTEEGAKKSRLLKRGSVVLSCSGTKVAIPGILAVDACIHDGWLGFKNFKEVNCEYLYYLFVKLHERMQGAATTGGVFNNLTTSIIRDLRLGFPSLPEQQKIASFLTSVDTKIEQLTKKKDLLEQYKKGVMQQIFSQQLRFKDEKGNDYPEWEEKKIEQLLKIGNGRDYKHLSCGEIPVYGTGGLMTSVNEYLYDGESVCIGRKGTIDKPMYLLGKFWTVDTLFYTYSFEKCNPKFIYYVFRQINWIKYNEASGVPSLSKATISKIKVLIPSEKEQIQIANFLSAIDTKIELVNTQIENTQQFKKGLLQQMFV